MSRWVDFGELRQRVTLEMVILEYYGIKTLTRQGSKLIGPCPVHGGDSPRAFHADLDRNVWHCFSQCKTGGNQLDFVAAREGVGVREAALLLIDHFGDGGDSAVAGNGNPQSTPAPRGRTRRETPVRKTTPERNPVLTVKLNLVADHPHVVKTRELNTETIAYFGVGYCARGIMRGTIAIPVHDENGDLVAYAGRRLRPKHIEQHGKYKFPKGFRKDLVLFNCHRGMEATGEAEVILVEGFFSVMKLHQMGFENVVAAMGSDLSDAQADLLANATEVLVIFDGNEAGRRGAEIVKQKLAGRTCVRVCHLPDGLEPEDLSRRALRWVSNGMQALDLAEVSLTFASSDAQE